MNGLLGVQVATFAIAEVCHVYFGGHYEIKTVFGEVDREGEPATSRFPVRTNTTF